MFPGILQKLFENFGSGPKLRTDIVPGYDDIKIALERGKNAMDAAAAAKETSKSAMEAAIAMALPTKAGVVYLPTDTELASGKPDAGREGLAIVQPLDLGSGGGGLTRRTLWTASGTFIAERDGIMQAWLQQGGQGGQGGQWGSDNGAAGSRGAIRLHYIPITKGVSVNITVGGGGSGGAGATVKLTGVGVTGGAGGQTTITITGGASYSSAGGTTTALNVWSTSTNYGAGGPGGGAVNPQTGSGGKPGANGTQGCALIIY